MPLLPPSLSAVVAAPAETVLMSSCALLPLCLTTGFSMTRPRCWMPSPWLDLFRLSSTLVYILRVDNSGPPESVNVVALLAVASIVDAEQSV